jgi:hypothetical protein
MPGDPIGRSAAADLLRASDPLWDRTGPGAEDRHLDLDRVSAVLGALVHGPAPWLETVNHPAQDDAGETEVRVLGADAVYVLSTPWAAPGGDLHPTVQIRPLSGLRALEVDGFEFDGSGDPIGCTITLLFAADAAVRLGASTRADRRRLAGVLPSLRERLGV